MIHFFKHALGDSRSQGFGADILRLAIVAGVRVSFVGDDLAGGRRQSV
jgi:hypothetical protein